MRKRIQTLSIIAILLIVTSSFAGHTVTSQLSSGLEAGSIRYGFDNREDSSLPKELIQLPNSSVYAQGGSNNESSNEDGENSNGQDSSASSEECEQLGVPILGDSEVCPGDTPGGNIIYSYLALIIEFLSAGVGLVITLMIAVSGVQYIMARDDPKKIEAAKHKLWNAVLALILFILMYALINFIVPGGIF